VAQDFHAAFGLGADDKRIATLDSSGVALAAIQGLNQKLEADAQAKEAESILPSDPPLSRGLAHKPDAVRQPMA
jgi:hypothetical protein